MRSLVLCLLAILAQLTQAAAQAPVSETSNIAADERLDLYTTGARLGPDGVTWLIDIHGRVYRPVRSTVRKAVIAQALRTGYGVAPDRDSQMRFDERLNLLFGDNRGGRRIVLKIGGADFALPESGEDGHFRGTVRLPAAGLEREARGGTLAYAARLSPRDPRTFSGAVLLIAPTGRSVISDVDDTVKVSHVIDTERLMAATFVKPYEAVPGMARAYQSWAAEGAAFHFVSSTPWHLYEPLTEFLTGAGFPPATFALKQIRLKDTSIANLFADATRTKPAEIQALLAAWPDRTFVLVGDSGEKDPEIYADFMRRHPARIEQILIRNVTAARADDARFRSVFADIEPARWQLFTDAAELPRTLGK